MGANLVAAVAVLPEGMTRDDLTSDWLEGQVEKLTHRELLEIEDGLFLDVEENSNIPDEDLLRAAVLAPALRIPDELAEFDREIAWLFVRGGWVVLTGGMSWGDNPTDAFDQVLLLAYLCEAQS